MKLLLFCLLTPSLLLSLSAEEAAKRVEGHLLLHDYRTAMKEAELAKQRFLGSEEIEEVLLKAFAKGGEGEKLRKMAVKEWQPHALEELAWGIIRSEAKSGSLPVQAYAAIASSIGRDMRGVELLRDFLHNPSVTLRALSVSAIAHMRDPLLQEEAMRLLANERNAAVRLELLRAVGSMKLYQAQDLLEGILASDTTTEDEQKAALEGLLRLYEEPSEQQIVQFTSAKRAGLRRLACYLVDAFEKIEWLHHLEPLKGDGDATVRQLAWLTTGWLKPEPVDRIDENPTVAIIQAWVSARSGDVTQLKQWLKQRRASFRHLAASAACRLGERGVSLVSEMLTDEDPYLRLNAALTLVNYPRHVTAAATEIQHALKKKEPMMRVDRPFPFIRKSELSARTPQQEVVNLGIRLELLNQLAILGDPKSVDVIHGFLKDTPWGIPSIAVGAVLQEGDETARDAIYSLLEKERGEVQLQAALTLALWGRDSRALEVLQGAYATAPRRHKEQILSALGAVGDKSSIPFLQERLGEPSPQLRLIAAASLLQCLNS